VPTPAVAAELGMARTALANWVTRRGDAAVGSTYRGWQLVGKGLLPDARKPGWLWRRVDA